MIVSRIESRRRVSFANLDLLLSLWKQSPLTGNLRVL